MAWSDTDLTAIETAIASGTLRVRYSDREVLYRDFDDLMAARQLIRGELYPPPGGVGGPGTSGRSRCTYASFSKDDYPAYRGRGGCCW